MFASNAPRRSVADWIAEPPEGFEIPVFRAVLHPKLLLGVPQEYVLVTGGLFVLAFFAKIWVLFPVAGLLHLGGVWATKRDPQWAVKVWRVAWEYARYYKP